MSRLNKIKSGVRPLKIAQLVLKIAALSFFISWIEVTSFEMQLEEHFLYCSCD